MRRLRDFQQVDLQAGEVGFRARVVAVTGDEARLQLLADLPEGVPHPPFEAQMSFDHLGRLTMLSGVVSIVDDRLVRFVVADGVRASDKRRHARLNVALPTIVQPLDEDGHAFGPPRECVTKDISAGGALLAIGHMPARVRATIELPGTLGTVEAVCGVVRSTDHVTACCFIALDAHVQGKVERFVETVRAELARRFAARAAAA